MEENDRPILIVIGNYKNGGIAKRASMLANGFADRGRIVTIVVTKEYSKKSFFELNNNVSIIGVNDCVEENKKKLRWNVFLQKTFIDIRIRKTKVRLFHKNALKKKLNNYRISKLRNHGALKWILSMYKYPIIIVLGLAYAADVFGVLCSQNVSIIYATRTFAEGELKSIDNDIATAVLKGMKCVVCQTHYTMDYFKKMGVTNLEVIPNPLIMEIPPYTGIRTKRIVNFCRISREKNLEMLIDAFSEFHREYPEYSVDVYGNIINEQEQAYKDELIDKISLLGLSEVFTIHPAIKNVHETVQDAAMFISTSEFEGLSNSMIEAMALGIPCICTDCDGGGSREMIQDGINGLLVPKNDSDLLYKAMIRFASNPHFAEKCGRAAAEVREKTAINTVIAQWNDVIKNYC